ncbi:MAG: ABC transporter ATP-binding protein [Synergistaceae bacterium]|nr:ABC transporter ATP-binding protein [Synergistaceae bacterium]
MAPWLEARFSRSLGTFRLDVDLVMDREIGVLFGPSGAGKSQTLRALAGLTRIAKGTIALNGRKLTALPSGQRRIGFVFQDLALFPHLSALENVAYGLKGKRRGERARHWLKRMHLEELEDRKPLQLSGGQRQRVALARALAPEPDILLLDEPFSALDSPLRRSLRRELKQLHRETGTPILYVTHQIEDVCALGDRIFFMSEGTVTGQLPVDRLWENHAVEAAWRSIGWGTLLTGEVRDFQGGIELFWEKGRLLLPPSTEERGPVRAFIAPDQIKILYPDIPVDPQLAANILTGTVVETVHVGSTTRVDLAACGMTWQTEHPREAYASLDLKEGETVRFAVRPRSISLLAPTGPDRGGRCR